MNVTDDLTLRVERSIRATPARVFAAWTEGEQLRRWSAPEGMTIEDGATDLRVGGSWHVVMVQPDGTRHHAFGRYREITPPARLVYTHQWKQEGGSSPETVVTVEFKAEGDATRVVLTQEGFASVESRNGHVEGWTSTLKRLATVFEEGA